jgi:hypothetical protein
MAYAPKQILVELPKNRGNGGLGSANYSSLQDAFPGSPVYSGEINDETVAKQYIDIVTDATVDDEGHMFGAVDLNYTGAPNLADVEVGGGGLPGSPYAPNIASPPSGQNPADIPSSGVSATAKAQGSGAPFSGDGLANPSDTSKNVSKLTIGSLPPVGKSSRTSG